MVHPHDSFDADFGVDEWHGSAFYRDGERKTRTYFINNRDEQMGTPGTTSTSPLGRVEVWENSPEAIPQTPTYSGGTGTTATPQTRTHEKGRVPD